ncbi:MAG: MBOAT family protein [Clostridia bacterium]|nr:MBOAT family protein [Clostridia bacterium]
MLFSSIPFLYYFLPIVLICYFLAPKGLKNAVLLVFSLGFYAWGEPRYVFLMIATVLVNYFMGLLIDRYRGTLKAKASLAISCIFSLGSLAYFKYADFFIENFNLATGLGVKLLNIALPIGISFYTFQILSYTIDVYRNDVKVQKSVVALGAYVSLFPQLIAGPIVRYSDVERELKGRVHSFDKAAEGIRRFVIGLSKKVIIANTMGEMCDAFKMSDDKSVLFYWLFAIGYTLQIYFDFSGYSDMAIGLGKILGFEFMENFNYPFTSKSITEFWRRWHISLGSWFRDYVYIPMGGNRVGKARLFVNIFTVWFLTGFWHGAEWNFIVWGLFFGVLLTLEKFFYGKWLQKLKGLNHVYVLFAVLISFVIFSASGMGEAMEYVGGMFGYGNLPLVSESFVYNAVSYIFVIILAVVGSTPIVKNAYNKLHRTKARGFLDVLELPILLVLLFVVTAYLADGSFNPFLYFRF